MILMALKKETVVISPQPKANDYEACTLNDFQVLWKMIS